MRGITEERLKDLCKKYSFIGFILAECTELNAWHPIETAPHDKWLLVADASNSSYIGKFVSQYGRWYVDIGIHVVPTHWQELPEDPK